MSESEIIARAQKAGININANPDLLPMQNIAMALEMDPYDYDINEMASRLDFFASEKTNSTEPSSDIQNEGYVASSNSRPSFGEREYNAQRGKDGTINKDYYKNRGKELDDKVSDLENEKGKKTKEKKGKDGTTQTINKSKLDQIKDRANLIKARQERIQNKISEAKSKAYQVTHPQEILKDKAKQVVDNVKDKAKESVKQVSKKARTAIIEFFKKNPYMIGIALGVLLLVLILVLLFASDTGSDDSYYDSACNFNDVVIVVNRCDSDQELVYYLDEYVISETYRYTGGEVYDEDLVKALMLSIKTNALSMGNYESDLNTIYLNSCVISNEIDSETEELYKSYYDEMYDNLYLDSSYNENIKSLSSNNVLNFSFSDMQERYNGEDYISFMNNYYNNEPNDYLNDTDYSDYQNIFIGDSRTQGMLINGIISQDNTVYGSGYGYYWLSNTGSFDSAKTNAINGAIAGANSKMNANEKYNIIIWLGVNDFGNVDKYFEEYKYFATDLWQNNNIFIVEVGPVDDAKTLYVKNSNIISFNNRMEELIKTSGISNLKYINLNYNQSSIDTYDSEGVHYSKVDYQKIYDIIVSKIGSKSVNYSGTYSLYNLSLYCTKYTDLTENDYWWWPIGSRETTEKNGKTYALGNPANTRITAGFNSNDSVHNGKHSGIDLAGQKNVDNVIATKSGTVIYPTKNDNISHGDGSLDVKGCGNYVVIDHGDGFTSKYCHMYADTITVFAGDHVDQGQVIGKVGTSGQSTGPHLHFEIMVNNVAVNPLNYINSDNPRPISTSIPTSVTIITGSDSKNTICRSLLAENLSINAVAGIMANFRGESGFIPYRVQSDFSPNYQISIEYTKKVDSGEISKDEFIHNGPGGGGYGLAQWTFYTRKTGLYEYVKERNLSIGDLEGQLNFMFIELEGRSELKKYLTGNYSAYDMANQFCLLFEGPKDKEINCPIRANNFADNMVQYIKNGCSD